MRETAPEENEINGEDQMLKEDESNGEDRILKEELDKEEADDLVFYPLMELANSRKMIDDYVDDINRMAEAMEEMSSTLDTLRTDMKNQIEEAETKVKEEIENYKNLSKIHQKNSQTHLAGSGSTKHGAFKVTLPI